MEYTPEAATGRSEQAVRAKPVGAHTLGPAVGVLLSL